MEAIGELKVLTNGLSAEYGRLSGGAITVSTRSGSNQYHGSGYEFLRNDKLNANDWNSNRFARPKGVFHDNVFGGSLGGPVRSPCRSRAVGTPAVTALLLTEPDRRRLAGDDLRSVDRPFREWPRAAGSVPGQSHPARPHQSALQGVPRLLPAAEPPRTARLQPRPKLYRLENHAVYQRPLD